MTRTCSFCKKTKRNLLIVSPLDSSKAICSDCVKAANGVVALPPAPPRPPSAKRVIMRKVK